MLYVLTYKSVLPCKLFNIYCKICTL